MAQGKPSWWSTNQTVRQPLLTRSWEASVTGWVVVFGAILLAVGAAVVTNRAPMSVTAPCLIVAAVFPIAIALAQWWQVTRAHGERSSWWHLGGVAIGALLWVADPIVPSALTGASSGRQVCGQFQADITVGCLQRADYAVSGHTMVWLITGGLIVGLALLTRRARIAPWASIPVAIAGCSLSYHYLELLLLHYNIFGS
jgi:hypothetical protein